MVRRSWAGQPGDVILVRSLRGPFGFSKATVAAQAIAGAMGGPSVEKQQSNDHLWTHVAIYDGRTHVIDATPSRHVRKQTLADFLAFHEASSLRLRRFVHAQFSWHDIWFALNDELSSDQYGSLATAPYSAGSYIKRLMTGRTWWRTRRKYSVVCSTLAKDLLQYAKPCMILKEHKHPMPRHFAASGEFSDVEICWLRASRN